MTKFFQLLLGLILSTPLLFGQVSFVKYAPGKLAPGEINNFWTPTNGSGVDGVSASTLSWNQNVNSGLTANPNGYFGCNGWSVNTSRNGKQFFQWSLSTARGVEIVINRIVYSPRKVVVGSPSNFELRYSTDAFVTSKPLHTTEVDNSSNGTFLQEVALTTPMKIEGNTTVQFRLYCFGATVEGNGLIMNLVELYGESPIPALFTPMNDLGTMGRWYRNMPHIADSYSKTAGEGIKLAVPSFLLDPSISFPYKKREGYEIETLFADNVNVVRFLGGWSSAKTGIPLEEIKKNDLAYRDNDGQIKYRWELIPNRLDPIVEMGYQPNIVLDNTPWCFPQEPWEPTEGEGYGQANPPSDINEWETFIEELCKELVRRYTFEKVNNWGFRLGTEAGGSNRFNGTDQEYIDMYKATARAVQRVLPGARVMPFNRSSTGHERLKRLLQECRAENLPYSASPISSYSIAVTDPTTGKVKLSTVDPDFTALGAASTMWYEMDQITPPESISREVHEIGWFVTNELGERDNSPGARGAAANFHYWLSLRQARLDKLYHWNVLEPNGESEKVLFNGQGFFMAVWDHCQEAHVLELKNTLKYTPQSGQQYRSYGFFNPEGKSYIMVSGYNLDRTQNNRNQLSVYIPNSYFDNTDLQVSYTTLNDSTDVYRMFRNDMAKEGALKEIYLNDSTYLPQAGNMLSKNSLRYYLGKDNNYLKYVEQTKRNLTLKPFTQEVKKTEEGTIITFQIQTPELMVLALEHGTTTHIESAKPEKSIRIVPNPAQEEIHIMGEKVERVEIYSLDGTLRKRINLTTPKITIGELPEGVYLIKTYLPGKVETERLIKQ